MIQQKYFKLANGMLIPSICYGTDIVSFDMFSDNSIKQFLKRKKYFFKTVFEGNLSKYKKDKGIITCAGSAINAGCIFFDTSRAYGASEKMLSECLRGYKREGYYICTKLCNYGQLHDKPAKDCLMESMEQLGVDYVDLYLLHWPVEGKYLGYWKQLENLYKEGVVKAIGVSNCKIHHLEEIKKNAEILPMVNEVELHPLLSEVELRKYCRENSIQIMAYTSTARLDFRLKASRRMKQICDNTQKSLSQVILRWHIQNGIIPIFNTSAVKHLRDNMEALNFELSDKDMAVIDSMNINARTRYDSDNCEWDRL